MALFFMGSAFVNAVTALRRPDLYVAATRDVALLRIYRDFITGFFSRHTAPIVLLIALGQLLCGLFLVLGDPWLWWETAGVMVTLREREIAAGCVCTRCGPTATDSNIAMFFLPCARCPLCPNLDSSSSSELDLTPVRLYNGS